MAIEVRETFRCSPSELWEIVGDVGRTDWVPGVSSCTMEDDVRRMSMAGAGDVAERILVRDPERHVLEYSVIESQPPLQLHLASIEIEASGSGATMIWRTEVQPRAVEPFIEQAMSASFQQLHLLLDS